MTIQYRFRDLSSLSAPNLLHISSNLSSSIPSINSYIIFGKMLSLDSPRPISFDNNNNNSDNNSNNNNNNNNND